MPLFADPDRAIRDFVISEYAHSEEAMIRTTRWKLIYHTGKRERDDGYTTGGTLPGRNSRLYDVEYDPEETANLADANHRTVIDNLMDRLRDRLVATERDPTAVPGFATREDIIDWCLTRIAERRAASAPAAR
jgi:choline-sulfatase